MSYPSLPFALVTFLAEVSEERSKLRKGPRHITLAAQHDKGVRSQRYEIDTDDQLNNVTAGAVDLYTSGPVDTMALIYPTVGDRSEDIGVLLEMGKAPMVFSWTFAPAFTIRLIEDDSALESLRRNVGVENIINLMTRDQIARDQLRQRMQSGGSSAIPAALAAPTPSAEPAVSSDYIQDR